MELTKKERLILANQFKILEKLYPGKAEDYSVRRKALESGFALHYATLFEHIYDEMPEEQCREVLDILNMYRVITFSLEKIEDKGDIANHPYVQFPGFNGNTEINYLLYAEYFITDLGRFKELKYDQEYPDLNSHMPTLDKYRRMLLERYALQDKKELTKEDIVQILDA